MEYQFTRDVGTKSLTEAVKRHARLKKPVVGMEIGCFEGKTTLAVLRHIQSVGGKMICVDPFLDRYIPEETPYDDKWKYFEGQYERFCHNVKRSQDRIIVHRGFSQDVLPELVDEWAGKLDFIIVDGDHRTEAVYRDGVLAFPLLKKGGVMIFDDYGWGKNLSKEFDCKAGIDRFVREYRNQIQVLQNRILLVARKK